MKTQDPMPTPKGDKDSNELPKIRSFDILVYAYLKEEMVNTPDSSAVVYLNKKQENGKKKY